MKPLFLGTGSVLLGLASMLLASAQDGDTKGDRIKAGRQMYAKLPPVILGLTEPIQITFASGLRDGGSVEIRFEDAKNNARSIWLDRKIGTKTRDAISLTAPKMFRLSLAGASAEEAALYGILLRWTDQKTPGVNANAIQTVRDVLELRVLGNAPVRSELDDGNDGKK